MTEPLTPEERNELAAWAAGEIYYARTDTEVHRAKRIKRVCDQVEAQASKLATLRTAATPLIEATKNFRQHYPATSRDMDQCKFCKAHEWDYQPLIHDDACVVLLADDLAQVLGSEQ